MFRRTLAIVNLETIYKNLTTLTNLNQNKPIIPVIKADAYGHGALKIFEFLFEKGVRRFAVATLDEAFELSISRYFQSSEILIFCPIEVKDLKKLKDLPNLIPIVSDIDFLKAIEEFFASFGIVTRVGIEIDTGMGRLGIHHHELKKLLETLLNLKHVKVTDLMSHFPSSDFDREFSINQINLFDRIVTEFKKLFPNIITHFSNSGGVLNIPEASKYDFARCGLSVYGYYPNMSLRNKAEIQNSMSLISYIALKKFFRKGESISYNRTFFMKKDGYVAVVPIGYADGISTLYSNNMEVLINGKKYNLVGRVTMDYIMILVDQSVEVGDEVVIFGKSGENEIRVEEFAKRIGIIPYEATCFISKRVPRIYVE